MCMSVCESELTMLTISSIPPSIHLILHISPFTITNDIISIRFTTQAQHTSSHNVRKAKSR